MKAGASALPTAGTSSSTGARLLITKALKKIVIDKSSVEEAMEVLKPAPS